MKKKGKEATQKVQPVRRNVIIFRAGQNEDAEQISSVQQGSSQAHHKGGQMKVSLGDFINVKITLENYSQQNDSAGSEENGSRLQSNRCLTLVHPLLRMPSAPFKRLVRSAIRWGPSSHRQTHITSPSSRFELLGTRGKPNEC